MTFCGWVLISCLLLWNVMLVRKRAGSSVWFSAVSLTLRPYDQHIQGIGKYLLKEWMVDYVFMVDNTLKLSHLFRKNSVLSMTVPPWMYLISEAKQGWSWEENLIVILIMVNAVFPKQNLIPALGYIRDSKWMCGTIDFFFPFLRGKKKWKYTAIQSRNGLVTTKIGVSLPFPEREKQGQKEKKQFHYYVENSFF